MCRDSLLPLCCLDAQSGEERISLRGRDRLRSDPQCFPGSRNCCSGMFSERLRNKSELVGSEGTRQLLIRHPRYEILSYWILLRVSYCPPFDLFRNWGDVILSWFRVKHVLCSTISSTFRCFSRNCCYFLFFLGVAMRLREKFHQRWILSLNFILVMKMIISSS